MKNTLGKNIKNLRKASGMTQRAFAAAMGTTQQRVSEWERDKIEPSLYNVVKILKIFGATFEELTDDIY